MYTIIFIHHDLELNLLPQKYEDLHFQTISLFDSSISEAPGIAFTVLFPNEAGEKFNSLLVEPHQPKLVP